MKIGDIQIGMIVFLKEDSYVLRREGKGVKSLSIGTKFKVLDTDLKLDLVDVSLLEGSGLFMVPSSALAEMDYSEIEPVFKTEYEVRFKGGTCPFETLQKAEDWILTHNEKGDEETAFTIVEVNTRVVKTVKVEVKRNLVKVTK